MKKWIRWKTCWLGSTKTTKKTNLSGLQHRSYLYLHHLQITWSLNYVIFKWRHIQITPYSAYLIFRMRHIKLTAHSTYAILHTCVIFKLRHLQSTQSLIYAIFQSREVQITSYSDYVIFRLRHIHLTSYSTYVIVFCSPVHPVILFIAFATMCDFFLQRKLKEIESLFKNFTPHSADEACTPEVKRHNNRNSFVNND